MAHERDMRVVDETEARQFVEKYGAQGIESGIRLQKGWFFENLAILDSLDVDFAQVWADWIYGYMYNRNILDDRTRVLVVIGECVVLGENRNLANHIRSAIRAGCKPEEVLEVILHTIVYIGAPGMFKGLRVFRDTMEEDGLLDQLPGRKGKRHTHLWPPQHYRSSKA